MGKRDRFSKLSPEHRIFVEMKADGATDIEAVRKSGVEISSYDDCLRIADEWMNDEEIKALIKLRKKELTIEKLPEEHELIEYLVDSIKSTNLKQANVSVIKTLMDMRREIGDGDEDEIKELTDDALVEEIEEMLKKYSGL